MKALRTLTVAAILVFVLCLPSTAAITEPVITVVVADTSAMTLTIGGYNLPNGPVYIGKVGGGVQKLKVTSSNATAITAQLPTATPGTYTVAIVTSPDQFWTGSVTIGAAGSQGPTGPSGIVTTFYQGSNTGITSFPNTLTDTDVLCVVGGHTAGENETALLNGAVAWQDVTAESASGYTAFSTDNGTTWSNCGAAYIQGTNVAGLWGNFARQCALPMTQGSTYLFGMRIVRASPSSAFTADSARCEMRAVIARQ